MRMRRSALLLLLLFAGLQLFSQISLTEKLPVDPTVKVGKLPNGLTYYIRQNKMPEKKVELRLAVNAGSVLEKDDQRGLAHFMEHMGFNGSKNFPKNELVDFLQKSGIKFGADLNAYTSFDETVYILPIPTEDSSMIDKGFTVLEDWAFNNLFDKNEIEKERGVVLEESRLSKGSFERMSRQYFPRLFNGSKYADRLPIGKDDVLRTFKPQTLQRFYKDWYRPSLMAVIVVGDIDPVLAEAAIKKHFGPYKDPVGAPVRPAITPIANRTKPEAMVVTDEEATDKSLQIIHYIKPAKKMTTWADYRENLVQGLVGSLISQRLSEVTQQANPPFVFASTTFGPFLRGYTGFSSYAMLSEGSVTTAIDVLMAETQRARQFGFLQTELDRAKASMLTGAERAVTEKDKSSSGSLVMQYVGHFLNQTPVPGVENRLEFLKQVLPGITVEEVNKVAKAIPSSNNEFTLLQAPAAAKKELPDNLTLQKTVTAASSKPVTAYAEKAVAASLMDKDPVAGKVTEESKNDQLKTTSFVLSNGITVTFKPTTLKNDEIQFDAWRLGGYQQFPATDKYNAGLAASVIQQMGVKDMSPTDLRKFMAGKVAVVSPYMNPQEDGVEGRSNIKDFETMLQLIYLYFTQPRRDEALFKSFISKQKSFVAFAEKDPSTSYNDTLRKIIYSNHPWLESVPKAADFEGVSLDRVMAIYQQVFGNAWGLHFTFVGNIDPAAARPLIEKYIASLPSSPRVNKTTDVGLRLLKGHTDIALKRGKASQAMINLFFEGEAPYTRESKLRLQALIEVLNIKIIETLREEMSGMYGGGLSGTLFRRPYEHYTIQATIPCGPENVDKLTAALTDILKQAQEKGIDQKDLDKVKETWRKQHHTRLQSNDFWLSSLSNAFINGENPEDVLDYEKQVDAITVEDLQATARQFLTLNNMVKSVLYPESSPVKEEVKTLKGF